MATGCNHENIDNMEKDQIIYDKRKAMGDSIRAMRTAQGWEQEQLAQIAGITAANVRNSLSGKFLNGSVAALPFVRM